MWTIPVPCYTVATYMPIRLQKFLSGAGVASRRAAEELIRQGLVKVNSQTATIGMSVDPAVDAVLVRGRAIAQPEGMIYLMLNKPRGYVTTRARFKAEKSVYDLLPADWRSKVWPVGRLDKDSCGLLLFTNDGAITQKLTHPKYSHEKEYLVRYQGILTPAAKTQLERGVDIASGRTAPCYIKIIHPGEAVVTIHEGKKRQIRYMFAAVHCRVMFLQRIREGKIKLGQLAEGKWLKLDSFK